MLLLAATALPLCLWAALPLTSVRPPRRVDWAPSSNGHSFGAHLHWEVRINAAITNPLPSG